MVRRNEKKGSQVGIVISFVMFVTFIFFFYIIIQPSINFESKRNIVDSLEGEMVSVFSGNITEVSVLIANQGSDTGCFELVDFFTITGMVDNFIARDNSAALNAQRNGNNLRVNINGEYFLRIYGSEQFVTGSISCTPVSLQEGSGYTLGLIKKDTAVFEKKIIEFIGNYSSNYSGIKENLRIPSENEFGFEFVYSNGTVISAQSPLAVVPASSVNIYVDENPVHYINRNALREAGVLRIKIW